MRDKLIYDFVSWDVAPDDMEVGVDGMADDHNLRLSILDKTSAPIVAVELDEETARHLAVELFRRSGMTERLVECVSIEVARMMSESYKEKETSE